MPFDDSLKILADYSIRIPIDDSVKILTGDSAMASGDLAIRSGGSAIASGDSAVATGYYVPEDDLWFGMDITAWKSLTIDDKIKEKNTIIEGLKSEIKEARSKGKSVSGVKAKLAVEKEGLQKLLERKEKDRLKNKENNVR
ncbi:unnamed protein product [Rotaria sp. Silwood1]|nr:unnamed protein product [Rotaria sp. Silwood1]CAF4948415.1 unnamed protein product [Rotaria sp. Silwood1]